MFVNAHIINTSLIAKPIYTTSCQMAFHKLPEDDERNACAGCRMRRRHYRAFAAQLNASFQRYWPKTARCVVQF